MRRLLFIVACLFSTLTFANDYIKVDGIGQTFEEAKKQAFRKAIEYKVGATVLSDIESQNYQRVKDEIYIYSAGYVEDYKVISQRQISIGVLVELDVKVSVSKIKNRIIGVGKNTQEFDGDKHQAQVTTFLQEREQGDRLLERIIEGFPNKAFVVNQQPHRIVIQDRNTYIKIPFSLTWNGQYLKSLRETLNLIQDGKKAPWHPTEDRKLGLINIRANDVNSGCNQKPLFAMIPFATSGCELLNSDSTHYIKDDMRLEYISQSMSYYNRPNILVTFKDMYSNVLYAGCFWNNYNYQGFYSVPLDKQMYFNGNMVENNSLMIHVTVDFLKSISKIELSVTAEKLCPR